MSDTATEKETELVSGDIKGIIQKGPDKWQVEVQPLGTQYSRKLWTKDSDLVQALSQKIGEHGAFVCGVSRWENNEGKPMRSLWINSLSDGTENVANASPSSAPQGKPAQPGGIRHASGSDEGMTPAKWDAKERRDYRSRAWAQTLGAFTHTIKTDEKPEDVFLRLQPFQRKVYEDVCGTFAHPEDGSDLPF